MKRNSKMSLALHALGHMALDPARPLRSEDIAVHLGTHAVVVRRALGLLREAGLVRSERGHAGGWRLARPAAEVSVAEVHEALGDRLAVGEPGGPAGPDNPPSCGVEIALRGAVEAALAEAEATYRARLSRVTLADLAGGLSAGGLAARPDPSRARRAQGDA